MTATEVRHAKVEVAIGYDQRADAAAAAVLRSLIDVVGANLEGAIAGEDVEYLHQLRIAVRRSRMVQRQFKRVFPALDLPGLRSDFRRLQRATGPARDLDVHVEEFEELRALVPERLRGALEPLRVALADRRRRARGDLERTLRSERTGELLADWERLLESLVELPTDDRPAAERSIGSLTAERVSAVYARIVRMGEAIGPDSPAESYHELRKRGKDLRYLLELFGMQLFDRDVVEPLVRALKGLQDLLGRHQDRQVQATLVAALADEVAARPGGPAACMAMGVLADRLGADQAAARREFPDRFRAIASEEWRVQVSETFG
ncbi:MAG TPA: CHAD domain-containing protein [Solirubrobacteraceae bacterium]|nr:CHAD domain-containing protein [Solirubrobacteraceae bacterium]